MNDTVKLIIEIPRNEYEYTCERTLSDRTFWDDAIRKGVPLDSNSDRAEVQAYFHGQAYGWEQGRKALIEAIKAEINEEMEFSRDDFRQYKIEILGADPETVDDELPHDDYHRGMERVLDIIDEHTGGNK